MNYNDMTQEQITALMSREDIMLFLDDTGAVNVGYEYADDTSLDDLRKVLAAYMFSEQLLATLRAFMEDRDSESAAAWRFMNDGLGE